MPFKTKEDKKKYHKEYHKKWYLENRDKQRKAQSDRKKELREWFQEYKSTLSCKCGEDHPATIDFHHSSGKKEHLVAHMANEGYSKERILAEIAKCTIMCANCHRKLHDKQRRRS
jgi:hypothetical protein